MSFRCGGRPREVGHVRLLARQHTEEAIGCLLEIMRDRTEKGTARVAAAQEILNRGYGKPAAEADLVLPPFDEWTDDMIREVFGADAQALIEAQVADSQQERLPLTIESR